MGSSFQLGQFFVDLLGQVCGNGIKCGLCLFGTGRPQEGLGGHFASP